MSQPQRRASKPKIRLEELAAFVRARRRPAVFLFIPESLDLKHVLRLRALLAKKRFDSLDLVINSGGGSIHAAYQIVELLRLHSQTLEACIPLFAKSAATLLCLGADAIVLDELAQLGPLDTQILEKKKGGELEFTSALNPFKTLEQLQRFSLETLDIAVKTIAARSGMDLDDCLKHAVEFVKATTGPLFQQLDPAKLGEYSRALSVGSEYADRLLRRFTDWTDERRSIVLERLVHGYPSHDYIIDYHELQEMGFQARLFDDTESVAARGLYKLLQAPHTVIELVDVEESVDEKGRPTVLKEVAS